MKIFAFGFYRVHAGLLVFLFATILCYGFFIQVLNQTHLPPDQRVSYNLILILSFITSPIVTGLVFVSWLIYTVKNWQYVSRQLVATNHQFLYYSTTSFHKRDQFIAWFIVQGIMAIPLVALGIFAVVIGIIFHYYLIPAVIVFYILALTTVSACLYVHWVNRLAEKNSRSYIQRAIIRWPKPYFSLFLYYILDKLKIPYAVTKVFSVLSIVSFYFLFPDDQQDVRVASLIVTMITTAHAVLLYQQHAFEETWLAFSRNFPYTRGKSFMDVSLGFLLLMLPEIIWIVFSFPPSGIITLFLFVMSAALLLKGLLSILQPSMRQYLRWVFGLFVLFFILTLFNLVWLIISVNIVTLFVYFFRSRDLQQFRT